jgi:hypothetical protein
MAIINGLENITVVIPEDGKGISATAVQKLLQAAKQKKLFISFDGETIRVTKETGQITI